MFESMTLTDIEREINRLGVEIRIDEDAHVIPLAAARQRLLRQERHARLCAIAAGHGDVAAQLAGLRLTELYRQTFSDDYRVSSAALSLVRMRMTELARHDAHMAVA